VEGEELNGGYKSQLITKNIKPLLGASDAGGNDRLLVRTESPRNGGGIDTEKTLWFKGRARTEGKRRRALQRTRTEKSSYELRVEVAQGKKGKGEETAK